MVEFAGFFNGKWGEPTPGIENDFPVFAGVDTHSFKWGEDPQTFRNELNFIINPFSTEVNQNFKIGNLTYFNGSVNIGTNVESVPLNIELELYDPTRITGNFEFDFNLISTPGSDDPEEDADFVIPVNEISSGSFQYKDNDYTIRLLGFSQDNGLTFTEELSALENSITTAGLYAKIESDTGIGTGKKDTLRGTNKDEKLDGKGGNDNLIGRGGNDILIGGSGKDKLNGGSGNDDLNGGKGNDNLVGSGGDDILIGGNGKDKLNGGSGNDDLYGEAGNDILTGGKGKDVFVYDTGRNFRKQDIGVDTIVDFVLGEDTIVLSRTTFSRLETFIGSLLEEQEFEIVNNNEAAENSDAFIVYDRSNGDLYYNENGSNNGFGSGGLFARLKGSPELEAFDIFIDN
ncbi:choice-of-anchor K domain-containing protein [Okeania sp.]|uniref:choice-of-anchor K domain-containing protein n=1 Tax=Okeania sp. TaxID=3100323 RepID=UPI002B4B800A|nr:choice-of-anchor K domain-containing protein [Okeania sp.]MEB3343434.1 choice-of-anchor K domain-containing protein [Okeania sp.]